MINLGQEKEYLPILSFPKTINFWIVRANRGEYLDDFIENNYIGLRNSAPSLSELLSLPIPSVESIKDLLLLSQDNLTKSDKQRITLQAKRIYNFTFGIKVGDIVFVPNKKSKKFYIGVITSDIYEEEADILSQRRELGPQNGQYFDFSNFFKRRKVTWIKYVNRTDLPKELSWIINSHQSIMDISKNKTKLMPLISPIFEYNGKIYFRIFTSRSNDISVSDWNSFTNIISDPQKTYLKANVNSPGFFTIITEYKDSFDSFVSLISSIWDVASKHPGTSLFLLTLAPLSLFGTDIRKEGLVGRLITLWAQAEETYHLHHMNKLEREKAEKSVGDTLKLSIKKVGTEIPNDHKKTG